SVTPFSASFPAGITHPHATGVSRTYSADRKKLTLDAVPQITGIDFGERFLHGHPVSQFAEFGRVVRTGAMRICGRLDRDLRIEREEPSRPLCCPAGLSGNRLPGLPFALGGHCYLLGIATVWLRSGGLMIAATSLSEPAQNTRGCSEQESGRL